MSLLLLPGAQVLLQETLARDFHCNQHIHSGVQLLGLQNTLAAAAAAAAA
jgi:hypothetical protein